MINIGLNEEDKKVFIDETESQTKSKKKHFIFIAIVFPVIEIIFYLIQAVYIIKNTKMTGNSNPTSDYRFFVKAVELTTFGQFFCTWGLISVCFQKKKCTIILLVLKSIFILGIIALGIFSGTKDFEVCIAFIIVNIVFYSTYYTLIIKFKKYKKPIL